MRPDFVRYSVTAFDPGARLVLTHGFDCKPRSTAFLATRPAATITDGLDVFVQLVMAAMTTEPWSSSLREGSVAPICSPNTSENDSHTRGSATRSCGRFGPATLGSTDERSNSSCSENCGSGSSS